MTIGVRVNDAQFMRDMNNLIAYSNGFVQGTKVGKPALMKNLGLRLNAMVGEFIDSNARVDPQSLHHVYEWYQTGSPEARLFDIDYFVTGRGLSMSATFRQSNSVARGATEPFYNKAKVMETGVPVTIAPRKASVLAFNDNGQEVFTKGPVTIADPGGQDVQNGFYEAFKSFFVVYASQSILDVSGLGLQLRTPIEFKNGLSAGKRAGKSAGISAGIKYISGGTV